MSKLQEGIFAEVIEQKELREQVSRVVSTNQGRAGLYSEFGQVVPLPDLTNDQYRQVIAEHSQ